MEMIAASFALVGLGGVFAWWDISKRKVGAGLSLVEVSTRVGMCEARLADLEKLSLDTRNKVAGLTTLANNATRRR